MGLCAHMLPHQSCRACGHMWHLEGRGPSRCDPAADAHEDSDPLCFQSGLIHSHP